MKKNNNIKTLLSERTGFPWYGDDRCRVRGSFFDAEGNYYSGDAMTGYFAAAGSYAAFRSLVAGANGLFSVVMKFTGECWLATDLVRSLPLFYCRTEAAWTVSDHADRLTEYLDDVKINETARLEFRGTGYVTGCETLVHGIQQVQAGEVLRLGEAVEQDFHHTYRTGKKLTGSTFEDLAHTDANDFDNSTFKQLESAADEDLANRSEDTSGKSASNKNITHDTLMHAAHEQMERAFSRMILSLEGKTAVVPLSGGYDSRLIAVMLKKHGYGNIVCFTYGRKGNAEAALSEKVAKKLGFPWYFVEYNQLLIAGFTGDPEFETFFPRTSNLSSMFFLQEYFAVKYLRDHGLIPGDAVFIPGHSGDFLGGSQFAKHNLPVEDEPVSSLARRILLFKYHLERYSKKERSRLLERITEQLLQKQMPGAGNEGAASWSVHEDWDLKEKLAKFNVNSSATYTFFGYAFRLPYYDRELVGFFRDLPVAVKRDKSLYDELLVNEYFVPAGVHFETELQTSQRAYAMGRMRTRIKRLLPKWLLALRRRKADVLFYREITARLREDLVRRGGRPAAYGSKYNKMIIDWYLLRLQEKISA